MSEAVLLKIKRQFTKDEAVSVLLSELKSARFNNGELLSEVSELKNENDTLKEKIKELELQLSGSRLKLTKDDLKEERFIELNKKLVTQSKTIKTLRENMNAWMNSSLSKRNNQLPAANQHLLP